MTAIAAEERASIRVAFGVSAGVPLGLSRSGAGEEAVGTSGVHGVTVWAPSIGE
jgi:hypothetical protein